jgi:hypothetical protein
VPPISTTSPCYVAAAILGFTLNNSRCTETLSTATGAPEPQHQMNSRLKGVPIPRHSVSESAAGHDTTRLMVVQAAVQI